MSTTSKTDPHAAPPVAAAEPMLVRAPAAGRLCGRSETSWWRDHAAGRVPAPVKVGGSTMWRTEDLKLWVRLGCPDRRTFQTLRDAGDTAP